MDNHKPECDCPQHTPPSPVRLITKKIGHNGGATFTKGAFHLSDSELSAIERDIVRFRPSDAHPVAAEPEQAAPPPQAQGFSNEQMAQLLGAFIEWMKNFRAAPPTVVVNPELKMAEHTEEVRIQRDERGQMVGSTKTVKPKE